ncbi:DUF3558 domain-containing protein [Rhodococcus sp. NPDC003322]
MRIGVAVGMACAALVAAGCGSGSVSGQAGAEGAAAGEPAFSPCDDIPDEALRGVGVDPSTESPEILGVKQPGFQICSWDGPGYFVGVFGTTKTMDDIRANTRNEEFVQVTVGERSALSYREVTDRDRRQCDVAVDASGGVTLVTIMFAGVDPIVEDPCAIAVRTANQLDSYIPE